jgi:hypothetical protein
MAEPLKKEQPHLEPDAGHVPITEEFDSAKWTLPPVVPVLIAGVLVAIIVAVALLTTRPQQVSGGSITRAHAVQLQNQESVLVNVGVKLKNTGEKPMFVRNLQAKLVTPEGEWTDVPTSKSDLERYYQVYPDLRQPGEPLAQETRIQPGQEHEGFIVVGFPVNQEKFGARSSLSVTVNLYDRTPLEIREAR